MTLQPLKASSQPLPVASDSTRIVKCQGCESECEVTVAVIDGKPVCLGGNNCPTGESFALSAMK